MVSIPLLMVCLRSFSPLGRSLKRTWTSITSTWTNKETNKKMQGETISCLCVVAEGVSGDKGRGGERNRENGKEREIEFVCHQFFLQFFLSSDQLQLICAVVHVV